MQNKIILASKSKVRKDILDKHNIESDVEPSNVDEDVVKLSLLNENASPEIISKNGSMIWNYTDKATLIMKNLSETELTEYLSKISDENLYAYNVYQIEGEGRNLFSSIEGDEDTIMGLPVKKIKEYLNLQK